MLKNLTGLTCQQVQPAGLTCIENILLSTEMLRIFVLLKGFTKLKSL